jgi:hypothetical protein
MSYTFQGPVLLRIQKDALLNPQAAVTTRIKQRLGYYKRDSLQPSLDEYVKQYLALC